MRNRWTTKKLNEVCQIFNGGTPDTKCNEYWGGENLWITPKDMGKLETIYVDSTERTITDAGVKNSSAKILPKNSVVLSSRAPIGHLAINRRPICTNQGCKGLVPDKSLETLYLFYFLFNNVELLNELGSGTTFREISAKTLGQVEIPFPPLFEQQRIVSILDEAFAAIAKAKANTEKNLQNAKELFESYLSNTFERNGSQWSLSKLRDVTTKIGSGATPLGGEKAYKQFGIPLIRSLNVYDGEFRKKDLAFLDQTQADGLSNVIVQQDDVLFNITGASVARCCIVPNEILPARVNQHVSIVRANKECLMPEFVQLALTSRKYKNALLKVGEQGATRQAITKAQLEEFEIRFPNELVKQNEVVEKFRKLKVETKKLETLYQQKLNDLEELKKSILQKAFRGELTEKEIAV